MALVTSMISPSHYGSQHSGYYHSPPSPPMDEPKCSLPSISNLLGLADAGSMASESSYSSSPRPYAKAESRPASRHRALPPTPPMSTDASFDARRSPSNSVSYAPSSSYYETTPPAEAHDTHRYRMASLPAISTSTAQPPLPPAMGSAHSAHSAHSPASNYYPAQNLPPPPPPASGLQYQRSLPLSFPPPPSPLSVTSSGGYVWQHHHYLNPSNGIPFPPSQDRYICQTCNKAFSRPSSLRIHSHSHTGEKPFKCPHAGCGKAFSVRSNMKRHERGCHGFDVGKGPIMLP